MLDSISFECPLDVIKIYEKWHVLTVDTTPSISIIFFCEILAKSKFVQINEWGNKTIPEKDMVGGKIHSFLLF